MSLAFPYLWVEYQAAKWQERLTMLRECSESRHLERAGGGAVRLASGRGKRLVQRERREVVREESCRGLRRRRGEFGQHPGEVAFLQGLTSTERGRVLTHLANLLTQAAGLTPKESGHKPR
jgi:hypothetical protein